MTYFESNHFRIPFNALRLVPKTTSNDIIMFHKINVNNNSNHNVNVFVGEKKVENNIKVLPNCGGKSAMHKHFGLIIPPNHENSSSTVAKH